MSALVTGSAAAGKPVSKDIYELDRPVFLVGFMGAGKTSVARKLARMAGVASVDMDTYIERCEHKRVKEIFAEVGEEGFRAIETQTLYELGMKKDPMVVSCGGGVVVRPQNVENMKKSGKIVFLKATPETIYERVKNSTDRPILNGHMNVEYIAQLMEKRRALYEGAADITIETDGKTKEEICSEIICRLEENI